MAWLAVGIVLLEASKDKQRMVGYLVFRMAQDLSFVWASEEYFTDGIETDCLGVQ